MPRLIDAIEARDSFIDQIAYMGHEVKVHLNRCKTIDAFPIVHGRWKLDEDGKRACSECERVAIEHPEEPEKWQCLTDYCPNCGAKMDLT